MATLALKLQPKVSVRATCLILLVVGALGCATDPRDPFDDITGDSKADGAGFTAIPLSAGETLRFDVIAAPPGATTEQLRDSVVLLEADVTEPLVVTMRAAGAGLDSYLVVRSEDGTRFHGDDQALMPMARPTDVVVVLGRGRHKLVATGGAEMDTGGSFFIDVAWAARGAGDVGRTSVLVDAFAAELRLGEPRLAYFRATGALVDLPDGTLRIVQDRFAALPLSERPELDALVATTSDLRRRLFGGFVELGAGSAPAIASTAASVWIMARAAH